MRRGGLPALLTCVALLTTGCAGVSVSSAEEPALASDLGAARVVRDQVYAQRDTGPLKLDLFLPGSAGPRPLVIYVHGGGWEAGNRRLDATGESTEALAAQRLLRRGYAVATVDYRLSVVARAPAQLVDVADAVRWLQRHAGRWAVDPGRVALWGGSAGGQIVAMLGGLAGDSGEPGGGLRGVRAVVDWFGPADMTAEAEVRHPELGEYDRRVVQRLLGCAPSACPAVADASSPVQNVSGDEPPFLIQHGMADPLVPVDQSLDLAAALRRVGAPVEMHPYEGLGHGFRRGPMTPRIVDTFTAFLATEFSG